jgi:hypothetical protein
MTTPTEVDLARVLLYQIRHHPDAVSIIEDVFQLDATDAAGLLAVAQEAFNHPGYLSRFRLEE